MSGRRQALFVFLACASVRRASGAVAVVVSLSLSAAWWARSGQQQGEGVQCGEDGEGGARTRAQNSAEQRTVDETDRGAVQVNACDAAKGP